MPKKPKWNEVPCPECKEPVAADATRCPHCQVIYDADTVEQRKKTKAQSTKFGTIGCGVLLLILVLSVAFCGSSDTVPEKPGETAQADAKAFYAKVLAAAAPCDSASNVTGEALKSGDLLASFRAARNAESVCLAVNIRDIEVPASVGKDAHAALTEARGTCDDAYVARWSAMKNTTEMLNGDGGIESLVDATDAAERSGHGVMRCVAGMIAPLIALGVDLQDTPGAAAESDD